MNNFKGRKINIYTLLLGLFFISVNKFFYIIELPENIARGTNHAFSGLIACFCLVILVALQKKLYRGIFFNDILFFTLFIIIQLLTTFFRYPYQSFGVTISAFLQYAVLLIYFFFSNYISGGSPDSKVSRFRKFVNILTTISIIVLILILLQAVIYNSNRTWILKIYRYSYGSTIHVRMRNNILRVYHVFEGYIRVSVLISVGWLLSRMSEKRKESFMHLVNCILGIIGIIYVDQSRVYLLVMLVSIASMLMFMPSKKKTQKWIIIITIILVFLLIGGSIVSETLDSLMNTMSDSEDGSNYARVNAILYYIEAAMKNPSLGIGLLSPAEGHVYYNVVHGPLGKYGYSDVGIFGVLGKLGFIAMIWYFFMLTKLFRMIRVKKEINIFNLGLFVCMALSTVTLIYLDPQRIIAFPITLSVAEYFYDQDLPKLFKRI